MLSLLVAACVRGHAILGPCWNPTASGTRLTSVLVRCRLVGGLLLVAGSVMAGCGGSDARSSTSATSSSTSPESSDAQVTSTASTVPGPTTPAPEEEVDYYGPIDVGYQFERTTWIVEANSITSEPPRQVELSDGSATVVPFELQVSAVAFTSDLAPTYDLATPTAGRLGVVDIGPEAVGERVDSESEHFLVGLQALPDSHSLYGARYAVMFVVVGSDLEPAFVGRAADEGLDRQLAALAQVTGSPSLAHNVAAWQTAVAASNDGDQAQLTLLRDAVHTSVP